VEEILLLYAEYQKSEPDRKIGLNTLPVDLNDGIRNPACRFFPPSLQGRGLRWGSDYSALFCARFKILRLPSMCLPRFLSIPFAH